MSFFKQFKNSALECKSVYSLAAIAMLLALRVVLGIFANATLPMFGNTIKLSAAFLPIVLAGSMFGPVPAMLVGALGDVLSYIVAPTGGAFFPGFTISGLLTGLIYGAVLYKNQVTVPRVIIGWVVNMLVVETFLAAYWLWVLYGYSADYTFYLSARFISEAVKCIPEIVLIFLVGKLASRIKLYQPKKS
ncbi:MAG: folate family ECF transporter S component [Ruminococcus sp.]|nr:folate family ECF transporter S component [Ruminococcus sp.]